MTVIGEISKLISILDEKGNFTIQRIEAVLGGDMRRARFIESQIYPEFGKRIRAQISKIYGVWKVKDESEGYETKQAN